MDSSSRHVSASLGRGVRDGNGDVLELSAGERVHRGAGEAWRGSPHRVIRVISAIVVLFSSI